MGPWNGSWNEYLPDVRVLHASGAFTCAIRAGRAFAAAQRSTLNPRVRGSSPWRRTRTELGILGVKRHLVGSAWNDLIRCFDANDAHTAQLAHTHSNVRRSPATRGQFPSAQAALKVLYLAVNGGDARGREYVG
jgi:hypothetical protein